MRQVFDLDDLCDDFDPWDKLHELKAEHPGLKVTLFAIPARCSDELLARYRALDWVELGTHGYHHSSGECAVWGYDETMEKLEELEELGWPKLFKAPGWLLNEEVYKALHFRGYTVADHAVHAWQSLALPVKRYTFNLPRKAIKNVHAHVQDKVWPVLGDEEFAFVSEVAEPLDWGHPGFDPVQDQDSSWSHKSEFGKLTTMHFKMCFDDTEDWGKIADFGGNDGFVAFNSGLDVTNIDADPERTKFSNGRFQIETICANLCKLPLEDDTYDWGFCSHTLEHIEDHSDGVERDQACLQEGLLCGSAHRGL